MAGARMRADGVKLAVAALFLSMPQPALATPRASTSALVKSALDLKSLSSAHGRSALVATAADYCRDLDEAFPRNSPSEDEWLKREFEANIDRSLRAMDTAEFSRRQVSIYVTSCLSAAHAFEEGQRQFGLSLMVLAFARFGRDAAHHAKRNSISPDDYGLPIMSVFLEGWPTHLRWKRNRLNDDWSILRSHAESPSLFGKCVLNAS